MKKLLKVSMLSTSMVLGIMAASGVNAQGACSVALQTENNWGAGAQYKATLTNKGAAKTGWELCWNFAGNETVSSLWEGTYAQTGKKVCVKNVGYNGNLATDGSVVFGYIASNPGAAPVDYTLNGASCGYSTSSAASVPSSASSSSFSSVSPANAARWLLDAPASSFYFVSVKKSTAGVETPENFTFSQLQGTVSTTGQATLTIPLTSISTNNTVRDPRMQSLLFEAAYLPNLHFTTQLDLAALDSQAVGSIKVQSVTGNLVLHGVVKSIVFDAVIMKHANNSISVSTRKPIVINALDFDLVGGLDALRAAVGTVANIGEKVPVYFKVFLNRDNPTNVPAISLATAPVTPSGLTGTVVSTGASLNWADVSSNETGFLVRRKGADGRWVTAKNLGANSVSHLDLLSLSGSYDYKVLSYTDSIPSAATAPITLVYETGSASSSSVIISSSSSSITSTSSIVSTSSSSSSSSSSAGPVVGNAARGATLWGTASAAGKCYGCHGDTEKFADGSFSIPVNPNRAYYHQTKDEKLALRDYIAKYMPQGEGGTLTAQQAADLEAFLFTKRAPSDGIPDNSITSFSCPSTATAPGQRTLRLLTRSEYQRSVRDLVNYQQDVISRLPDDAISGAFQNNNQLLVDSARYSSYVSTAERIADDVATRWNAVLACTPGAAGCADKLVNDLGQRIFRRPLSATEKTDYLALAKGTAAGRTEAEGMKVALAAMLSSPQFLYRSELGELSSGSIYKLTAYEIATYLAYTYTGTTPSVDLIAAAARGDLNTVAGIRTQASTLLNSANTKVLMGDFINRWLGTEKLATQNKVGVANFATLAGDMQQELSKNFSAAVLDSTATFATVYNPNFTYVNQRLATHYGVTFSGTADADGFVKATTADRGGILVSGAFMSRYARDNDANLITRAVAVRRKLMCQDIPEPPSGVSLDREALAKKHAAFFADPKTTERMIADKITEPTTCSNCHLEIINPLGGGMENIDAAGRIRTVDLRGNPIDASASFFSPYQKLQFTNDPDRVIYKPEITFNGAKDLARLLVEQPDLSKQAKTCLATQFVSFSSGVNSLFLIDKDKTREVPFTMSDAEKTAYRCNIEKLTNVLNTSGPRAMLQEIPALDSVIYRQEWAR
ncbi:MAG: carbohydrate-binding protein [Cellvibrio sp. 79]|nr:MAG: carbohydrate-binding protein [Cellvibrio sp. 79]